MVTISSPPPHTYLTYMTSPPPDLPGGLVVVPVRHSPQGGAGGVVLQQIISNISYYVRIKCKGRDTLE